MCIRDSCCSNNLDFGFWILGWIYPPLGLPLRLGVGDKGEGKLTGSAFVFSSLMQFNFLLMLQIPR